MKILLKGKYQRLYAPAALGRLRDAARVRNQDYGRDLPASLPRGATLTKEPAVTPIYVHSRNKPPRKLSALEVAQELRKQATKRGIKWPLA